MMLDNEIQRTLLLNAINASAWQGAVAEEVVKLKIAVASAPITANQPERIETEPED